MSRQYYIKIVSGDSLWSISNKFGITVNELKELNNLTSNTLKVGQNLKVKVEEEKPLEDYLIYTVKKGDSLYKIANQYNTTVNTLMNINNLNGSTLTINQQLLIPKTENIDINIKSSDEGIMYTVKEGDNLWKIANSYGITVDRLKSVNNLTSNSLQIGQQLLIPINDTSVEEKPKETKTGVSYVVVKGDNLYSIANKYGVTVSDIKSANNLTSNTLQIGDVLIIPGSENYAEYTVKKGDSLWKIANTYGVTVNDLMTINNLNGSLLNEGQTLLMPTKG